jgi:uncharacterized protein YndB with AHSA1/START domain
MAMGNVLIGIGVALVLFLIVVATRPATFHVERSITVAAPPDRPFAHVNDLHAWAAWSPFEKDPNMQRTFDGAPSGTGAGYVWKGDQNVGQGRMTIVKSDPPSQIVIELEFTKPFTATNTVTFTFAPVADGTRVTWAMDGNNNFVAKAVHLFLDMDKMVGDDFQRGLVALKSLAESGPAIGTARAVDQARGATRSAGAVRSTSTSSARR